METEGWQCPVCACWYADEEFGHYGRTVPPLPGQCPECGDLSRYWATLTPGRCPEPVPILV